MEEKLMIARPGEPCAFRLVCAPGTDIDAGGAQRLIPEAVMNTLGAALEMTSDAEPAGDAELVFGVCDRPGAAALTEGLCEDGYAVRVVRGEAAVRVLIAFRGKYAMYRAVDRLLTDGLTADGFALPGDYDMRGVCREADALITSDIPCLRDPCLLRTEDGTYYAYGTGWVYWKNTSGSLGGHWEGPTFCAKRPEAADDNLWAPEVHRWRGAYYMFTTYHSSMTGRRGTTILRADDPEGPFVEITGGQITPPDWDCIDGTLYVDPDGQPWLVFVREWVSAPGKVGRFDAARLSDDLTRLLDEPVELFRADAPSWARWEVTDGCWMVTTREGKLMMIWSNFDASGYVVGLAESDDGTLTGHWTVSERLLSSRTAWGAYDGGHGMLFTDADGQTYLSMHSPNGPVGGRRETPVFLCVREAWGTVVPDFRDGE